MSLTNDDKQWISGQLTLFNTRFEVLDARIEALDARIERVETSLLTESAKRLSPAELRFRTRTAMLRVLDVEMEALRVSTREGPSPS